LKQKKIDLAEKEKEFEEKQRKLEDEKNQPEESEPVEAPEDEDHDTGEIEVVEGDTERDVDFEAREDGSDIMGSSFGEHFTRCIFLPDAHFVICFYQDDAKVLEVIPFQRDQLKIVKEQIFERRLVVFDPKIPKTKFVYNLKASRIFEAQHVH